jgi:hypothetical protein
VKAPLPAAAPIDPQPLDPRALAHVEGARRLLKAAAVGTAAAIGFAVVADDDRTGHGSSGHYGPAY